MRHLIRLLRAAGLGILFMANIALLMTMFVVDHWLVWAAWVVVLALDALVCRKE
jgi:hypothetical protein